MLVPNRFLEEPPESFGTILADDVQRARIICSAEELAQYLDNVMGRPNVQYVCNHGRHGSQIRQLEAQLRCHTGFLTEEVHGTIRTMQRLIGEGLREAQRRFFTLYRPEMLEPFPPKRAPVMGNVQEFHDQCEAVVR
ncbi:MAG: hypothetical protein WCS85_00245 [Candidatus Peribacteraceae bacterium]